MTIQRQPNSHSKEKRAIVPVQEATHAETPWAHLWALDPSGATESQDLLVKPWTNGTGKGNTCQQVDPKEVRERREEASFQLDGGVDMKNWTWDEAKGLLEEAHLEEQSRTKFAAIRVGQPIEEMSQIRKLLGTNLEPADQ